MRAMVRVSIVSFLLLAVVPVAAMAEAPAPFQEPPLPIAHPQTCPKPDAEAEISPAGNHQARITLSFQRPGTLTLPRQLGDLQDPIEVTADTYQWILDPARSYRVFTWSFRPEGSSHTQLISVTHNGRTFRVSPPTVDVTPHLEEATLFYQWEMEQAARDSLRRTGGNLEPQDLPRVTSLKLAPAPASVSELCRFPNLADLELAQTADVRADLLRDAAARAPGLKRLTVSAERQLQGDPTAVASDQFPFRVETPHGIFLGDKAMDVAKLADYAAIFESKTLTQLGALTGLQLTAQKAIFLIYGDQATWDQATENSPYWGYYSAQEHRIHMAHWKAPGSTNSLLLAHELFHWLAWEEGKVALPTWLNEGLAHNLSWRIEQAADSWSNSFVQREWLRVRVNQRESVPDLTTHTAQDAYTITAVADLLQSAEPQALQGFFQATRGGATFAAAFTRAFGQAPLAYVEAYRNKILDMRRART